MRWPCPGRLAEVKADFREAQRRELEPGEVNERARIAVGSGIQGFPGLDWQQTQGGMVVQAAGEEPGRVFTVLGWSHGRPFFAKLDEADVDPAGHQPPNSSLMRSCADQLARHAASRGGKDGWVSYCYGVASCLALGVR